MKQEKCDYDRITVKEIIRAIVVALLIVIVPSAGVLNAQEDQPRVRIFPFNTPGDDPGIESLSETATDTLVLTLQLLGEYQIERGAAPSPIDSPQVFDTLKNEFVDYAVYGAIEPRPEGGYTITAYSWDSANDTVSLGVEMAAESAFDLFDSMDMATVRFAEEFTGIHIGFGRLVFDNRSPEQPYLVEIDDNLVGTDVVQREVLYGRRKISILLPPEAGAEEPYHLVSYLLEIEEGREYQIPFSVPQGLERGNWNSAVNPPVELADAAVIISRPRAARVLSGEELLGRTPLLVDPLLLTPGGTLTAEHPYFLPQSQPFEGPNQLFDLVVDPDDPAVKPTLNRVWLGAATNILITSTQVMFALLSSVEQDEYGGGPPAWPVMLAASPRFGFLLGDDLRRAGITSALSFAGAGLILAASELEWMHDDLSIMLWQIPFWSVIVYDLVAPPFYAAADNRRTLSSIKENGLPDTERRQRRWLSKPYVSAQVGGGAYFMAGTGFDAFKEFLAFDIYAGISGDYFEPFKPIPSVTAKTLFFPAAAFELPVKPYAAALAHMGMNDLTFSGAVGPALGVEVPTDFSWLPRLTFFFEAQYYYSPVGAFPMIGFGGKRK